MIDFTNKPLDEQYAAFVRSKFLAMPIAGTIAWTAIGVAGAVLPPGLAVWALFIGTGGTYGLGVFVSRFTGEDLVGRKSKGNRFDKIFLHTVFMAVLVYAIAIPFFMVQPTSLPMSVGILAGLMWIPFSALIDHWVGLFHGISRTALLVFAHYAFPAQRFVLIPALVVLVYLITIAVLYNRYRAVSSIPVGAGGVL